MKKYSGQIKKNGTLKSIFIDTEKQMYFNIRHLLFFMAN